MNTTIRNTALASILFAAASGAAFAADTADLTVKGVIKPAACTPTLSGGGIVDFGTIPANSLSDTTFTRLPEKWVHATITCDAPAKLALKAQDNRIGTASLNDLGLGGKDVQFGFGEKDNKKLGAYSLYVSPYSEVDGTIVSTSAHVYVSTDNGNTWSVNAGGRHRADGSNLIGLNPAGGPSPATGKVFVYAFRLNASIESTPNLPALNTDVQLDGSAALSVVYL